MHTCVHACEGGIRAYTHRHAGWTPSASGAAAQRTSRSHLGGQFHRAGDEFYRRRCAALRCAQRVSKRALPRERGTAVQVLFRCSASCVAGVPCMHYPALAPSCCTTLRESRRQLRPSRCRRPCNCRKPPPRPVGLSHGVATLLVCYMEEKQMPERLPGDSANIERNRCRQDIEPACDLRHNRVPPKLKRPGIRTAYATWPRQASVCAKVRHTQQCSRLRRGFPGGFPPWLVLARSSRSLDNSRVVK